MRPVAAEEWWWIRGGLVACLAVTFACLLPAQAGQRTPSEVEVKAAFVYNFAKFVEWPDDAPNSLLPIVVGVVGDSQLAQLVNQTLRGKNVRGRTFEVRQFQSPDSLPTSHVLFLASQDSSEIQRVLQSTQNAPTLTIGEVQGFCEQGGVIELFVEDNKFRFDINAGAARHGGLKVSSRLLRLARAVKGN